MSDEITKKVKDLNWRVGFEKGTQFVLLELLKVLTKIEAKLNDKMV